MGHSLIRSCSRSDGFSTSASGHGHALGWLRAREIVGLPRVGAAIKTIQRSQREGVVIRVGRAQALRMQVSDSELRFGCSASSASLTLFLYGRVVLRSELVPQA